ncbi:MAG TPA: hypothetical protein VKB05_05925 [Pyrinomonadaceae bacterium]|nr:hypothetical protein [Pyrinomonadaceae bacterium]
MRFEVVAALVIGILLPVLETARRGISHWTVNFTTMFEDYLAVSIVECLRYLFGAFVSHCKTEPRITRILY